MEDGGERGDLAIADSPPQPDLFPSGAKSNKRAHSEEETLDSGDEASEGAGDANCANGSRGQADVDDAATDSQHISKNELKRQMKRQRWEDSRQFRKDKRKEKRADRQARKRAEKQTQRKLAQAAGIEPLTGPSTEEKDKVQHTTVPVAFIIDCDFEKYMRESELVSLSSQVVRCYSQNRQAKHRAHLFISAWKGKLKERFETVLASNYKNWTGVHFVEEDYQAAAAQALELMASQDGDEMVDTLRPKTDISNSPQVTREEDVPPPPSSAPRASVVYLSADSPHTLERLEPHTCYIIGGIVDKNREKGLCERLAVEKGVQTAKLPIGEYMLMQSRKVLTTNHVVEILSHWLECGDWASSFFKVIPKRKGGVLRGDAAEPQGAAEETKEVETEAAVNGAASLEAAVDGLDNLEAMEGEDLVSLSLTPPPEE